MIIIENISESQFDQIKTLAHRKKLDFTDALKEDFFAVTKDELVIGFARIRKKDSIFELSTMGVEQSHRNKGVGVTLIEYALRHYNDLYLVTVIPEYFEKFGFKSTREIPSVFNQKLNNYELWHGYGTPVVMRYKRVTND